MLSFKMGGKHNDFILVHDLTNRKSHQNLHRWLAEVLNRNDAKDSNNGYDENTVVG
jgi:Rab-like protein 3